MSMFAFEDTCPFSPFFRIEKQISRGCALEHLESSFTKVFMNTLCIQVMFGMKRELLVHII